MRLHRKYPASRRLASRAAPASDRTGLYHSRGSSPESFESALVDRQSDSTRDRKVRTVRSPGAARRALAGLRENPAAPSVQVPSAPGPSALDPSAHPAEAVPAVEKKPRLPPQPKPLRLMLRGQTFSNLVSRLISFEYGSIAERRSHFQSDL